jgi:hypothetical protein
MSTVKANDLTNVTGGIPTVKSQHLIPTAWVSFNGENTVAIKDSEGVSSITDLNVGWYRVVFTATMPNTNYATLFTQGSTLKNGTAASLTTAGFDVFSRNDAASFSDTQFCSALVMGGQ